jgi:hypothetical protein
MHLINEHVHLPSTLSGGSEAEIKANRTYNTKCDLSRQWRWMK